MSTYIYLAEFDFDLGKMVPEIGDLMSRINEAAASAPHEHLGLRSGPLTAKLTVNRQLTTEEQYQVKTILEAQMIESFPKYGVRLTSFSCQPVTPKSSAS